MTAAMLFPSGASAKAGCTSNKCVERVAMHQCSNKRVRPCIKRAALHYKQTLSTMMAIVRCESGYDPGNVNPRSGASGLFQFLRSTFNTGPYSKRDILSAKWNALAGGWEMRQHGTFPWVSSQFCWG